MANQEPDFWQARWREDLPEPIPAAVLSKAEAMSSFHGCLLCSLQLQPFSPDDSPMHYAEDISSPHASRVPYYQCRILMATCLTINRSQSITYMGKPYRPTLLAMNAVLGQYSLWLLTLPGQLTRGRTIHLTRSRTPQTPGALRESLIYNQSNNEARSEAEGPATLKRRQHEQDTFRVNTLPD